VQISGIDEANIAKTNS